MKWERKYYTYTLLQIPNKAESIIVMPLEGVSVELSLITPFFLTDGKYIGLLGIFESTNKNIRFNFLFFVENRLHCKQFYYMHMIDCNEPCYIYNLSHCVQMFGYLRNSAILSITKFHVIIIFYRHLHHWLNDVNYPAVSNAVTRVNQIFLLKTCPRETIRTRIICI